MADVQPVAQQHGVMAEFSDATELLRAAKAAYADGYRQMDAYSAAPIHGLAEALGHDDRRVQKLTFLGGVAGFLTGFGLCYWASVIEYPMNIGGRPLNSWVAFSIPTFELTILFGGLATTFGMLAMCGFPQPYHPVFNVEAFRKTASSTGFFLCIEASDPRFDLSRTRAFLEGLHPKAINEVNA